MVRPRLYGRGDIHNRELRRRRIKPIFVGFLPSFVKLTLSRRALRWEMRGSHFIEKLSPKKNSEIFLEKALIMKKNQSVLAFFDYFTYICTRI